MEFFKTETKFDFLRIKWICIGLSWALILAGLGHAAMKGGYRYGIDFSGGTQLILQFQQKTDVNALRAHFDAMSHGETVIQKFQDEAANQYLIRIQETKEMLERREGEDVTGAILDQLAERLQPGSTARFDINRKGRQNLADVFRTANVDPAGADKAGDAGKYYDGLAQSVVSQRSQTGIFTAPEDAAKTPGLPQGAADWIRQNTIAGPFVSLSQENVGPQVGKDLQRQATLAVLLSLAGMLVYIWFRFDVMFGIGAVVATIHDVLITLAFFSFFGKEITLVVIAAFLTLVGYSVNDTVVVYDRIRENMKAGKGKNLAEVVNASINQTLSRTILVSGTTMLAVLALFFFGGDVIHDFAFTLVVGIIIGTYSSIYVAAPIVVILEEWKAKRKAEKTAGAPARA
jgi:preprotein translocase subunit SecF